MIRTLSRISAIVAVSSPCLFQIGCASSTPHPNSSASAEVAPGAKPRAETPVASSDAAAQPAQTETTAAPAKDSSPKPADERDGLRKASRPPLEQLTGNNVVYVLNFADSKVGTSAKERCESQNSDNPAAARECIAKERGKLPVESVRFVKSASGQYWWVTYNRYKGNLLKWHSIQFLPGKTDADAVSLTLTGKDKGIAPIPHVPPSLNVALPNDYSIIISDPDYGEMVFDAKIGLLEPDQPE
jgi:hypothetical protein